MNKYSIDLNNKYFFNDGKKTYFSSNDKICIYATVDGIECYIKQSCLINKKVDKIKIDKKCAKELINIAHLNIELIEDIEIDNQIIDLIRKNYNFENKIYNYESSNEIQFSIDKKRLALHIYRDHMSRAAENYFDYHEITPYIAQLLINCAHLKINI